VQAVLSLPILFAAGMSLLDTTDGVLMVKVYNWAFVNPPRKLYYNLVITGLSVAVALLIGSIEWLQVIARTLHARGALFRYVDALDFSALGYLVVALFVLAWLVSVLLWKYGGIERRFGRAHGHAREHSHADGRTHTHRHFPER
jgi:high-affinity nickel-transport protein